jgi:hypothetical protein
VPFDSPDGSVLAGNGPLSRKQLVVEWLVVVHKEVKAR